MAYKKEELVDIVRNSNTFSEVLRKLGRKPVGGSVSNIKLTLQRHGIDFSHMTGQAHLKGRPAYNKKTSDDIFVMGTPLDRRQQTVQLRRALLEVGVPHVCNVCGLSEWQNKPIVLQIDHIDEQYWNNQRDNLQFICPNCHSQKEPT